MEGEGKGEEWEGEREGKGEEKETRLSFSNNCMVQCVTIKFYYSLLSPVVLPASPDSMAPSRAVRIKRNTSSDVNFILGWPVTRGRRDR